MQDELEKWFRLSTGLIPPDEFKNSEMRMLNLFFSIETDDQIDTFFNELQGDGHQALKSYSKKSKEFSSSKVSVGELMRSFAVVISHQGIAYEKKIEKITEFSSLLGKSDTEARRLSRSCLEDCLQDQINELESFSDLNDSNTRMLLSLGILKALLSARDNSDEVKEFFDFLTHRISKSYKMKELGDGLIKRKPIWSLFLLHSTKIFQNFIKCINEKNKREIFLEFEHAFNSFEHCIRDPVTRRFMDLIFWFGALITHKDTSKMEKIFFTKEMILLFNGAKILEDKSPVKKRSENILKVMDQFYAEDITSIEPQLIVAFSARYFFPSSELNNIQRETIDKYRLLVLKPFLLVLEHLKMPKRKSQIMADQNYSRLSIVFVQDHEKKPLPLKAMSYLEELIFLCSSAVHIGIGGRAEIYKGDTKGRSQSYIISKLQSSAELASLHDKGFLYWKDIVHWFMLLLRFELDTKLNELLEQVLHFLLQKEGKKEVNWFHELAVDFESKSLETTQLVVSLLTEASIRMKRIFLDEEIKECKYNGLFVSQVYILKVALTIVRRIRSKEMAGAEFEIKAEYFGAIPYALMITIPIETRALAILSEASITGVIKLLSEQSTQKGFLTSFRAFDWLESLEKHLIRNCSETEIVSEVLSAVKELQVLFTRVNQMDVDTKDVVSQSLCEWLLQYDQLNDLLEENKFSQVAKELIALAQMCNDDHIRNLEDRAYNADESLITEKILQQFMLLVFLLLWFSKTGTGHNKDDCKQVCHAFVTTMKALL